MKCWKCRTKLTRLKFKLWSPLYYCSSIECDRFGMLVIDVHQYDYMKPEEPDAV